MSEKLVYDAAKEAYRQELRAPLRDRLRHPAQRAGAGGDQCEAVIGMPATYVQATPDLMMGDLLKNMRASQIFSVCGLPEVEVRKIRERLKPRRKGKALTVALCR